MTVLIVAAHPDDEVLGCGGTLAALTEAGVSVRTCILSGEAEARQGRPDISELMHDIERANEILGIVAPPIIGHFPNIRFNAVPHLEMVQFIENAILESGLASFWRTIPEISTTTMSSPRKPARPLAASPSAGRRFLLSAPSTTTRSYLLRTGPSPRVAPPSNLLRSSL